MTRFVHACLVLAALVMATTAVGLAQNRAKAENVPEIPFESVPNFPEAPPGLFPGRGWAGQGTPEKPGGVNPGTTRTRPY